MRAFARPRPLVEPRRRRSAKVNKKNERPDLRPASHSDEVYTPSLRRSEGRRDQLGGRCPSRAASKTSLPTLNGQRNSIRPLIMTLLICIWFNKISTFYFARLFPTSSPIRAPKCHSKVTVDN